MTDAEALALLGSAIRPADGEVWADLGAGTGVFTRALASLVGPGGRVFAVDADAAAVARLRFRSRAGGAASVVEALHADVARSLSLPPLHGVVMANVLHFMRDTAEVLALVASQLRTGGRLVLIEYEGRRASPWVPHPVSAARFRELAGPAGLTAPEVVARRPSAFGGEMYVATARREG